MDGDCMPELRSLRKRSERDEDGEMERLIHSISHNQSQPHRPQSRRTKVKKQSEKMTISELLEEGPGRRPVSKKSQMASGDAANIVDKNECREDGRSSTASKNSEIQPPTTSHSFKSRGFSQKWKEKDTRLFYKALSLFGTDFSMVALLFKGRDRSQLINKYHKEERDDPKRVEAALRQHRQGSSKVLKRCNNILAAPPTEVRRIRGGSGSSLDSLDELICEELDDQIARARSYLSTCSIPGSSGQPI